MKNEVFLLALFIQIQKQMILHFVSNISGVNKIKHTSLVVVKLCHYRRGKIYLQAGLQGDADKLLPNQILVFAQVAKTPSLF